MAKRKIGIMDIIVGQPLPWNVFGEDGKLLLRAGETVGSESSKKRLVSEGLYTEITYSSDVEEVYFNPKNEPSVVRILNRVNYLLRKSLPVLAALPDASAKIREFAEMVYTAVELDSDVAVACIFLNQKPGGPYNFRHNTDTAIVASLVARAMKIPREEIITGIAAALTANLGMLDYQDHLDKKQGPLTQEEKDHLRTHPAHSVEMLKSFGVTDEAWLAAVLNHHENEDGSGYPNGKKGEEIPVFAKLIGLADRYCARVTSSRKLALPSVALKDIFLGKHKEIDGKLAQFFIKEIGLYPPGSFVRLKNYEIGVVYKNAVKLGCPDVFLVLTAHGMPQNGRILRQTTIPEYAITESVHKETAGSNVAMQRFWGVLAAF